MSSIEKACAVTKTTHSPSAVSVGRKEPPRNATAEMVVVRSAVLVGDVACAGDDELPEELVGPTRPERCMASIKAGSKA